MHSLPKARTLLRYSSMALLLAGSLQAAAYEKQDDGILLQTDDETIQLEVFAPGIIHVQASPLDAIPESTDYMVVEANRQDVPFEVSERRGEVRLQTEDVTVAVDKDSGRVRFFSANGKTLLSEVPGGRRYEPTVELGESTYQVQQAWELGDVQVIHGLGGQQNGIVNFVGEDALLAQYNTVDVNTFFLTDQNWGLLWDNNSITHFGDPRPYQPIGSLELKDASGEPGALTARYYRDNGFEDLLVSRRETDIAYDYLSDADKAPEGFDFDDGSVRWTGTFAAKEDGVHKFQLYGSEYSKVWIDDELVVDSWRQNWMPYNDRFQLDLEAGEPHKIEIEWVSRGGYKSLRVLPPEPEELDEQITLTSDVGEKVDYYFVQGSDPDNVIQQYRRLTGTAPLMPKWALGKWQCRERYKTQEELLGVVQEFREREIPLDAIVQDWNYWPEDEWGNHTFDPDRFPDPEGMVRELHEDLNTHIMISVWPKFYRGIRNYERFAEHDWLYPRNIELGTRDWIGEGYESTFYDAFNPEAGALFWQTINEALFSKGFDAWWLDATEPDIHSNISIEERKRRMNPTFTGSGARNYNAYSINNSRAIYQGQREEAPNQRVFILTRSAFAGQQRYAAATWSGDVASRWSDFKKQITYGINFSAAGIPYWTTDIGGFAVEPRYENPNADDLAEWRELNMRWYQFGAFCPLFRVHGQFPYREIYNIAPEGHPVYEGMLRYDKLRYRLMPYIYGVAGKVTHEGYSFTRPLMFDFPDDPEAVATDDAFLFGPSILVCPVTEYRARQRTVHLPDGADWYDMHTGERLEGGQTFQADAPLGDLPLYVRAGSIIPFGPNIQYVDEKPDAPIELRVYPGADASFTLYNDAGTTYDYEDGAYAEIEVHWDDAKHTLSLSDRHGSYADMPDARTFRIVVVDATHGNTLQPTTTPQKTVHYHGQAMQVKL
ncbi:MAG: glycosyl hydrolase family 31 [Puniceicoccaceae bacterium 5H]|nr:MAG: glycosyl hydrolase family 31 [Puniceicoccaceae bacterium 5H]